MKITLAGLPGSGKSTVSKHLEKVFALKRYDIGDLRGKMAMERGMTIDELNKLGEKEKWTDRDVDEYQKKLGQDEDDFVISGRLSWFFIPDSVKLFMNVDPKVGARRILLTKRDDEKKYGSAEEVEKTVQGRLESDKKRYGQFYGVNPYELRHFDVIIDTSDLSEDKMCEEVEKAVRSMLK